MLHMNGRGGGRPTTNRGRGTLLHSQTPKMRFLPAARQNELCSYENPTCTRDCFPNQKYCVQHTKVVRGGSFNTCNYLSSKSAKRCTNVAFREHSGKEGFCQEHLNSVTKIRRRAMRNNRPRETAENLLGSLKSFAEFNPSVVAKKSKQPEKHGEDVSQQLAEVYTDSSDESDFGDLLSHCRVGGDDFKFMSSTIDEPLKHAGVFSPEEIVTISRDKLLQLQSLYLEEMRLLEREYRVKRSHFLRQVKAESLRKLPAIETLRPSDMKERQKLKKLKALRHYKRHLGVEALLRQQALEQRKKDSLGDSYQPKSRHMCTMCGNEALPFCNYCADHILCDAKQLLFTRCAVADCRRAVLPSLATMCGEHASIPAHENWHKKLVLNERERADVLDDEIAALRQITSTTTPQQSNVVKSESGNDECIGSLEKDDDGSADQNVSEDVKEEATPDFPTEEDSETTLEIDEHVDVGVAGSVPATPSANDGAGVEV